MTDWSEYYRKNKEKIDERSKRYRERIKEEENLTDSEYNSKYRYNTAFNRGMTVTDYNRYLEEQKAKKLNLTVKELRNYTYIAKRDKRKLFEVLNIEEEVYKRMLKRKDV